MNEGKPLETPVLDAEAAEFQVDELDENSLEEVAGGLAEPAAPVKEPPGNSCANFATNC